MIFGTHFLVGIEHCSRASEQGPCSAHVPTIVFRACSEHVPSIQDCFFHQDRRTCWMQIADTLIEIICFLSISRNVYTCRFRNKIINIVISIISMHPEIQVTIIGAYLIESCERVLHMFRTVQIGTVFHASKIKSPGMGLYCPTGSSVDFMPCNSTTLFTYPLTGSCRRLSYSL